MKRTLFVVYSLISYFVFFGTFLYAVGFAANFGVPRSLDQGPSAPLGTALAIDAAVLLVFALQHSVMARAGFKRWWTRIMPAAIERSTFVLAASLALMLVFWQWRPIGGALWDVHGTARAVLIGLSLTGWAIVFVSTFLTGHLELFGVRQAWAYATDHRIPAPQLSERGFYAWVRHPLYLGFAIAFWATPRMTVGHLVFAVGTLGYMLVAIQLEERDLIRIFGDAYRGYRERVSMLAPVPTGSRRERAS